LGGFAEVVSGHFVLADREVVAANGEPGCQDWKTFFFFITYAPPKKIPTKSLPLRLNGCR